MLRLIDTHCHVHFPAYDSDRREVILRARDHGVGMVFIGTKLATSHSAIEMASWYGEGVWASVGLHPNYAGGQEYSDAAEDGEAGSLGVARDDNASRDDHAKIQREEFDEAVYLELARHPKVVGIGETGLDYFHIPKAIGMKEHKQRQHDALRAHIRIADAVQKPLIIHCRDAHEDLLVLMDEEIAAGRFVKRGILHCFTGTAEQAAAYVVRGCMISFSGVITFPAKKSSPEQQESLWRAVRETSLGSILVETDAPYLSPEPNRGKRNEPAFVKFTAEKVAELKGVSMEKVEKVTTANAVRVFGMIPSGERRA